MKVELTPTITNQKTNIFSKIRRFFVGKLKPLMKDTFEKSSTTPPKIVSRKYPNWCEGADSTYRNPTIAETVHYYPEDVEKMKTMTKKEKWDYMDYLDKIGRFYYGETLTKKEYEEFMCSLGLNPEKYYIKE